MGDKTWNEKWRRWDECSLCEQDYYGVVRCALGWACWKTYLGRPEADWARRLAMGILGIGLRGAKNLEDALSVQEAELSTERRNGAPVRQMLDIQSNIANTYSRLGRFEEALRLERDVYRGSLRLLGEKHEDTMLAANNYASSLIIQRSFEEAKSLLRKMLPVARRCLGESKDLSLRMRWTYSKALYADPDATLDDVREAVTTLEETARVARRVFGGANPITKGIEGTLQKARANLRAREASSGSA